MKDLNSLPWDWNEASAHDRRNTLNNAFKEIGSNLRVKEYDDDTFPVGDVELGEKLSQIHIDASAKGYSADYWRNGVCLANGGADEPYSLLESINYWLKNDISTAKLAEQFPFISPNEDAIHFDEGKEVPYSWNWILENEWYAKLKPIVSRAMQDEILGKLFPFTSMNELHLSRCTGYPYTRDLPWVMPTTDNKYQVTLKNSEVKIIESPDQVILLIKGNLPKGIGPAVAGTADNIKST